MTKSPKLALAAALLAGLSLSGPALAKDKDQPAAAAPSFKFSPAMQKVAKPAQDALNAKNLAAAEPAVAAVEAAASNDDDKYVAAVFRLQLESLKASAAAAAGQPTNEAALKAPLEALFASPKTPADKKAAYSYERGRLAFNERNNKDTITWLTRAQQLGYRDPNMALMIVQSKVQSGDTAGGIAELDADIQAQVAAGQKPAEDLYKYGLSAAYKSGDKAATIAWIKRRLAAYPTSKNWRDLLIVYGLTQKPLATLDKEETIDLYRLMRQAKALPDQQAYEEYAYRVINGGLPDEGRAVILDGRAAGKLPATGGNAATLLGLAQKGIAGQGSLAGLDAKARGAATGSLASQTADAYLGQGNYAKAIALYQAALQKGGINADTVTTRLGIAQALGGDKAAAKASFAAVKGQPRADLASFWSLWLDTGATA